MRERVEMASPATSLNTPLAAMHAASGAKMGVWLGCAIPDDFGDPAAEYRYARDTAALIDKNYRAYLGFTGPDRVRYLNAILTNNIKDLREGHGVASLLLNPQGHILAEIETYAFADRLFCVSYAMIREHLIEWLDKYIIMDDVTLTDETVRYGTLALEGPKAAAIVQELSGVDLTKFDDLSSRDGALGAIPCRLVKRSPGEVPSAEFVTETANLPALWQLLSGAARKHGGGPMGYTALSGLRLAQGVPWFGYDFGEKQIPHEAGLRTPTLATPKAATRARKSWSACAHAAKSTASAFASFFPATLCPKRIRRSIWTAKKSATSREQRGRGIHRASSPWPTSAKKPRHQARCSNGLAEPRRL